jgi:hypothetical protein
MNEVAPHDPRLTMVGEVPRNQHDKFVNTPWKVAEFCRLPRPRTRCPITNLSRTTLEEHIKAGNIRAKKLRKPGSTRGIVLIETQSLLDFVNGLPDAGSPTGRSVTL